MEINKIKNASARSAFQFQDQAVQWERIAEEFSWQQEECSSIVNSH